jgi:hypothetical protein
LNWTIDTDYEKESRFAADSSSIKNYREAIDGERDTNASAKKEPIALQAFDMLSPLQ